MWLSARNKVLIAGIIGAVVLIVGVDLLMADYSVKERALDLKFLDIGQDGVPAGFYMASTGIALLAASGFISGVCYTALDRAVAMKTAIVHSMTSGAAVGLLIFLAACAMIVVNASSGGLAKAAVELFTGAFEIMPLFILVLILLAAFGALGGISAKLAIMGINKIGKSGA